MEERPSSKMSRIPWPDVARAGRAARAVGRLIRHPVSTARLAHYLDNDAGASVARFARSRLSERQRRIAVMRLLLVEDDVVMTFERGGFTWTVDTGDEVGLYLFTEGRYEGEELDAVLSWLRVTRPVQSFATVVDVGANVGTTSLPVARAGWKVIAIEPVPKTFQRLVGNVEVNDLSDRVVCVQKAISSTGDLADLWVTKGAGQAEVAVPAARPAFSRWGYQPTGSVQVAADGLTSTVESLHVTGPEIALVWSDTQGSERAVIETGRELWSAGVPLYIEVYPAGLALHGAIDAFVDRVRESFSTFVSRDQLVALGNSAPMRSTDGFADFVAQIDDHSYSDALLIP
jgi:FkbM family methyltransferase